MVVTQCNTGCGSDNSKKPGMARVQPKPYYIPWGVTTALVLMFNLAAGIVFAVDMQYPIVSNTSLNLKRLVNLHNLLQNYIKNDACNNNKLATGAYLGATAILPMWFGRFVILWFTVLIVWVMVMSDGKKNMVSSFRGQKTEQLMGDCRSKNSEVQRRCPKSANILDT